jgi:hypothetical protein
MTIIVLAGVVGFLLGLAVRAASARAERERLQQLGRNLITAIEADQARRAPSSSTFRELLQMSFLIADHDHGETR